MADFSNEKAGKTEEVKAKVKEDVEHEDDDSLKRGVAKCWTNVNHIAIVVSDVGRSLQFYSDIVGLRQVPRPNFDRHGAWLTFGDLDLHLIKGRPAVHSDDDLIVSHIALDVADQEDLKDRLAKMDVQIRENVPVPNPGRADKAVVEQVFLRDPDGYYLEFCNCSGLEEYLRKQEETARVDMSIRNMQSLMKYSGSLSNIAGKAKKAVWRNKQASVKDQGDSLVDKEADQPAETADPAKLGNLLKRRKIYGDIMQNATEEELVSLLKRYNNRVPDVVKHVELLVKKKGSQTLIPPAFYDTDGKFCQPPAFEMPVKK